MSFANPEPHGAPAYACPHCQTGNLTLQRVVYARWYGPHFVTIPNFPSWVCDVCGSLEYDAAALDQVRLVLGRATGGPSDASRRAAPGRAPAASPARPSNRRPI